MLGQRRRRCTDIDAASGQCLVDVSVTIFYTSFESRRKMSHGCVAHRIADLFLKIDRPLAPKVLYLSLKCMPHEHFGF